MTHLLYAISVIHRPPTEGPLTEMTGYDKDGNAIVRATSEIIQPGQLFEESTASEVQWLIANDAAREPTARELEIYGALGVGK